MRRATIRKAVSADAETLRPLVKSFVTSFELDADAYSDSFARLLENESALLAVAESDRELVGYLLGFTHDTLYANGPVAWVEEVMVHPNYRRAGVGAALVAFFESWCRDAGAALSALATRRAAGFYTAIGYEESAVYYRRLL